MNRLTIPQIAAAAAAAGFTGEALIMATAIALRESGGQADVMGDKNNPAAGCNSWGLMQINVCPRGTPQNPNPITDNPTELLDPVANMRAAFKLSKGGTAWGPWTTYRAGIPAPDIARVRRELGDAGNLPPVPTGDAGASLAAGVPGNPIADAGDFVSRLADPKTWRNVQATGFGLVLLAVGLYLLAKDLQPIQAAARTIKARVGSLSGGGSAGDDDEGDAGEGYAPVTPGA